MSKSKNKSYNNPNMVKFSDVATVENVGWFCRAYYPHIKQLVSLSKPAQKVIVGILGLFEDTSNERIKNKIGFMPWESKINMTQADFAREFNMNRDYVAKGIKELLARNILIKQDGLFYISPIFFSHQDYYNKEVLKLFNIKAKEKKAEQSKIAF